MEFEDLVLKKLNCLERDISKLKKNRVVSTSGKSKYPRAASRSREYSQGRAVSGECYSPKYIPMNQKIKVKDITNMIREQDNYSIPSHSGRSKLDYLENKKNFMTDRDMLGQKVFEKAEMNRVSSTFESKN